MMLVSALDNIGIGDAGIVALLGYGIVFGGLIALMIPIMIMNVMQTVFGIVDMIVLRYFANDTAVGAVGTSATYMGMFTAPV